MTPPLFICFFNQLFTGIVGCGLTSRGNGADFGILRMDFIKSCFVKISAETALAAKNNAVPATKAAYLIFLAPIVYLAIIMLLFAFTNE
ncbi:TPA: hypothetical protein N3Z60_005097 [Klebsiella pneumoniae]|nr:hypothetical protein [Klebsiella pneumoniae subsp. pneumoniae]MCI7978085.1 hypothetical protein [Klebsiella pneumoniae]HBS5710628.1 hypothetical protein [Klebsiella pneumoniae]HCM6244927.1 hypothetical protein [Klebsiella pneumoniae]